MVRRDETATHQCRDGAVEFEDHSSECKLCDRKMALSGASLCLKRVDGASYFTFNNNALTLKVEFLCRTERQSSPCDLDPNLAMSQEK